MGHVSAPEPTSEVGAVRSWGTRVSAGALLCGEAGSDAEGHVAALEPPRWRGGIRSHMTHDSAGVLLDGEMGSVTWDMWQRRSPH
jgi:hypothetical protein